MIGLSVSDVSLLFPSSGTDPAASLVGGPGRAGGGNPVAALTVAVATEAKGVAATKKQPEPARAIAEFKAAIAGAKTPAALAKDPRFLAVLLPANGLSDQSGYTALVSKALLSDLSNPKSLANTLADRRFKTVAKTLDFAAGGLSVIRNAAVQQTLIDAYATTRWEAAQDAVTPGLSKALAFRAQAKTATSADAILGNATLRAVVQTTLNIPAQIAFQGLPEQERAITSRLDIKKLQDPKFVEGFARRYLIQVASNGDAGAVASPDLTTLAARASSRFA